MYRFAALVLFILALPAAIAPASALENDGKTRIVLLFVVKPPDENSRRGVESWYQLFEINIRSLLSDVSGGGPDARINVVISRQNVDDMSGNTLEESFGRQPSLQVLKTVGAAGGDATLVVNQIYLGEFKGSLDEPYVYLSRKVIPFDYKITREALAAVTLYAYAMAVAKVAPEKSARFAVCRILDRANMYKSSDLDPDARGSLENLFRAISTELEARACGGKR
jgi:hypothetical protein